MKSRSKGDKELDKLRNFQRSSAANKQCFDCGERGPTYLCVEPEYKTFLCTACSGLHRELSHKIKGISVSKWSMAEVDSIVQCGGNDAATKFLLATWRSPQDDGLIDPQNVEKMRNFIRMKYLDRRWTDTAEPPTGMPQNCETKNGDAPRIKQSNINTFDFDPGGTMEPFDNFTSAPATSAPITSAPTQFHRSAASTFNIASNGTLPNVTVLTKDQIDRLSIEEVTKIQQKMEDALHTLGETINMQLSMLKEQEKVLLAQKNERQDVLGAQTLPLADFPTDFDLANIKMADPFATGHAFSPEPVAQPTVNFENGAIHAAPLGIDAVFGDTRTPSVGSSAKPNIGHQDHRNSSMNSTGGGYMASFSPMRTPASQTQTSMGQMQTSMGQMRTSMGQMQTPTGQMQMPMGQMQTPTGQMQMPMSQMHTPTGQMQMPTGQMQTPIGQMQMPMGQMQMPTGQMQMPMGQMQTLGGQVHTPVRHSSGNHLLSPNTMASEKVNSAPQTSLDGLVNFNSSPTQSAPAKTAPAKTSLDDISFGNNPFATTSSGNPFDMF